MMIIKYFCLYIIHQLKNITKHTNVSLKNEDVSDEMYILIMELYISRLINSKMYKYINLVTYFNDLAMISNLNY